MLDNIKVLCHSSIKFNKDKVIYFDPFKIDRDYHDADFIFITHSHYDHFSEADIEKIRNANTEIIIPEDLIENTLNMGFNKENVMVVMPNKSYKINEISFETILAYNINKAFHPKENNWLGYVLELNGVRYYIAGDTDITEENMNVNCDVALVPVGGTYTMDYNEAAKLVNTIRPKIAVPTHYGSIVGTKQDAENFIKLLDEDIKGAIL